MGARYHVKLTKAEREELLSLIAKKRVSAKKSLTARILLKADSGEDGESWSNDKIAEAFEISARSVVRLRKQFMEEGLETTFNRKAYPKIRHRKLDGEEEAHLIAICCSTPPTGRARWTLRLLADHLVALKIVDTVSHETIRKTLKKNELKPWLSKEWCIPPKANAAFVCAMEDILVIYQLPYNPLRPVVCMDESSKQLLKETRIPIALQPSQVKRFDTEYERNGTYNIFLSCEPLKGWRNVEITDSRTKVDWAHYIKKLLNGKYADVEKILLVSDNLNTHNASSFYEAFPPQEAREIVEKLEFHYTPKHGSWLNIAESELSHLSRQCLDRRLPDKETLIKEITAWNKERNERNSVVDWQFTTKDARVKLKRLYPIIK